MKIENPRSLPLQMLRDIEKLKDFDSRGYTVVPESEYYLLVKDPDPASDFFFSIQDIELVESNNIKYLLVFKPTNDSTSKEYEVKINSDQLETYYNNWKILVDEYSRLIPHIPQRDHILEQYQDEFYSDFELTDEDADERSFPTKTQLMIDAYLNKVVERLESYKVNNQVDETTEAEINAVIDYAKELQNTQTKQTKNQVARKLANILAQCKKISLKVLGEIRSEIVKGLVRGAMENPQGLLDTFSNFLS